MDNLVVVGAVAWFMAHPAETLEIFPNGVFPIDQTGVAQILMHGITEDKLQEYAAIAHIRGYDRRALKLKKIVDGAEPIQCFPQLYKTWREIDGTVPFSLKDQQSRFRRGPQWEKNSCAIDCIIVAALLLDAGRRQIDQLSQSRMQALSPLQQALIWTIRKPWSELSVQEINQLRNTLRKMLALRDPDRFPLGEFCGLQSVAEELLTGLPQLSSTWTIGLQCCQNGPLMHYCIKGSLKTRIVRGLPTTPVFDSAIAENVQSLDTPLQRHMSVLVEQGFGRDSMTENERSYIKSCGFIGCPAPFKTPILLDRLPPIIMMTEDSFHNAQGYSVPEGFFNVVQVQCISAALIPTPKVAYKVVGYIACIRRSHFVLCWEDPKASRSDPNQSAIYTMGCINSGKFITKASLEAAFPKGGLLVLVFLERLGDI